MSPDPRLVPAAVGAWLASAVLVGVPAAAGLWAALLGVIALGGALSARRARGRWALLAAALTLLAGTAAGVSLAVALRAPERQPAALTEVAGTPGTAEVVLTAPPRAAPGAGERSLVEGDLVSFRSARAHLPVRTPVLVFVPGGPGQQALQGGIGSRVEIRGTVEPADPGDDVAYLVSGRSAVLVEEAPAWLSWAGGLRDAFAAAAAGLPGDGAALLPGLALGDDGGVPGGLRDDMRESSLSHLTAVSGANCAVVVAAALVLARLAGLRRVPRTVVAGTALAAFVVLVTPQPSVLRAALMGVLVLVADASGRRGGGLPILCGAVVVLLCADPWLGRDPGFALSVLATAGLVVLARPVTALLGRLVPEPLAAAIAVPLCAQVACQPVLVLLDPAVSLWSVPANLLAAPAAPLVTLAGLAACVVLPVLPALGHLLLWLAWAPAAWIAAVARWVAAHGAGRLPWLDGPLGALLLAAIVTAVAAAVLAPRARMLGLLGVGALAAVLGAGLGGAVGRSASVPDEWRIASCDVGQGDATVLRVADGRFALIDTGPEPEALTACLDRLGVGRISLLVLTHFDQDHVGAGEALAGRVDDLLVGPSDGPAADRLVAMLVAAGARVSEAAAGDTGAVGDLRWRVLWPLPGNRIEPGNDASIVLETEGGGLRAVFLGDLGEEAQSRLLRTAAVSTADVVKVSHHGSADQSEALYERLDAPVALISCGIDNDYGHPAPRVLEILAAVGSEVFRTDLDGMLLVGEGGSGVSIWTERPRAEAETTAEDEPS
ncbi:ComEC/Rec2 family competence protein [Naasia sp. SYSU D00948]|uniref:ComEC/Rec2 family competence protein n=1 Tax=Naasia sp. SYSU D00948 TaxID=2817379 RepID=UPI001B305861|nr:ComEC/Rec2 family competence protein [Naasia sp. SYSU D00948]